MISTLAEKKKYLLKKEDHFQLWKSFNEDSCNIKDKLWTTFSWLFTLMGGVLAFIGQYVETDKLSFTHPKLVGVIAKVRMALCIYPWWMITVYGKHFVSFSFNDKTLDHEFQTI